jgi:hypothetical protein
MDTDEDIANALFDEIKGDIRYEEVWDIVRQHPDVSMDQYRLLLQLHQKTGRLGLLLNNGFTVPELRDMIIAGFIGTDFGTLVNRIQIALKNGTDRPGNPDGLTVQQIHDLAVNIANALNSDDPDKEFEGQTALSVLSDLVHFQQLYRWTNGSPIVDVDVETTDAIIEVTNDDGRKKGQVETLLHETRVNPRKKPVIVFGPELTRGAVKAVEWVDPDNIYYAKSWQQLKEWLLLLRD